jgi:hypothetical protein
MRFLKIVFLILVTSPLTLSFPANGQQNASVGSRTALPIVITKGISASTAHVGDVIYAKTTQLSQLPNGASVPSGTKVVGHVIAASGPVERNARASSDVAPVSTLTVRFEAIELSHERVLINAYVRAMADPIESDSARMPLASDIDPQGTTTQIGGDLFTPFANQRHPRRAWNDSAISVDSLERSRPGRLN